MSESFLPSKPFLRGMLATLAAGAFASANAVEINPEGTGQAVVAPLWTTTGGNSTLFSIGSLLEVNLGGVIEYPNQQEYPFQVARFRLFDGNGEALLSANVYFRFGNDQWTLALGSAGDGQSTLVSSDGTCVLVEGVDGVLPVSPPLTLAATHGYAEAISMGYVGDASIQNLMRAGDCSGLAARWNDGPWDENPADGFKEMPPGVLDVETSLVNVERGTLFSIPSTGLVGFSDITQHHSPGDSSPDLRSAHDPGTAVGQTTGRRCIQGHCETRQFADPLLAVHHALTQDVLSGNYNVRPGLGAQAELVLTAPLWRFFQEEGSAYQEPQTCWLRPHFGYRFGDREDRVQSDGGVAGPIQPPPCDRYYGFPQHAVVESIPFLREHSDSRPDAFQGSITGMPMPLPGQFNSLVAGWLGDGRFRASFGSGVDVPSVAARDRAVIGVMLTQYTNGYLVDAEGQRVQANYGQALPMKRMRYIQIPD